MGNDYGIPPGMWDALGRYRDHRVATDQSKDPKVSKLQLPRTEEGAAIPIVYGRCRVDSPILAYTGKLQYLPQTNSNNGASYVVYALDMLFVAGIPMGSGVPTPTINGPGFNWNKSPRLWSVYWGDQKLPAPTGGLPGSSGGVMLGMQVNRPFFLGGKGAGGGLWGTYTWFGGWTDQDITAYPIGTAIANVLGNSSLVPGHRKMMLVGFTTLNNAVAAWQDDNGSVEIDNSPDTGFVLGESPNIDGIAFEVSAYGDQTFSMTLPGVDFGGDADPAEVLYDILTNKWSRLGIDTAKIDTASFSTASAALKAENHGFSMAVSSQSDAASLVEQILSQIDGILYTEPTTGLITLKLLRADYDPATIPAFDASNIISVDDFSMGSWHDLVNEVRIQYTDRTLLYKPATAVAQSFGNAIGNADRRKVKVFSLPGITNSALAAVVAARKVNMLSTPLATIKLTVNRDGIDLRPGSVFKVTYPEYNLNGAICRVQRVDLGTLEDNKIKIEAVQDSMLTSVYPGLPNPLNVSPYPAPNPLATRTIVEAPRWLVAEAAASGVVTDPNLAHFLPLPVPSTNAVKFAVYTKQNGTTIADSALFNKFQTDVPLMTFPIGFTIAADYAREYEPYDNVHGLQINAVSGGQWSNIISTLGVSGFDAAASDIQNHGKNLVMLVRSDGAMELIAFETMSDLGGGTYRLNNVWRGLLDTPPIGFKAGDRGVFVDASLIGMRGWNITKVIEIRIVPCSENVLGSGKDPTDTYKGDDETSALFGQSEVACRSSLPLPPSGVTVDNEFATRNAGVYAATAGINQANPGYKTLALAEEALDLYGFKRDRLSPTIHKGSDADDVLNDFSSTTYSISAAIENTALAFGQFVLTYFGDPGTASPIGGQCLAGGGVRVDGYGSIDISLASQRTLAAGDPLIGTGGLYEGLVLSPWRFPRCTVFLPFWRNLLGNVRWNYRGGTDDLWNEGSATGTSAFAANSFALSTSSTYDPYFLEAAGSTTSLVRQQFSRVDGWLPRGLTAYAACYIRNATLNANDTGELKIECIEFPSIVLATYTTGAVAGSTGNWKRISVSGVIPANTSFIRTTLTSTKVSGGSTHADTCFTEPAVRIGPLVGSDVLTNGSFATYVSPSFTGWTNDTNNFLQGSDGGPSGTFAQGSSNASSVMHQDYTIPDGHQYASTFVLSFFFKSVQKGDSGTVKIAALDGSNNVLGSLSTESMNQDGVSFVNTRWIKRLLHLDLPDGTAKVRVTVTATRGVGNTTCGACFDEFVAFLFDDLPPVSKTLDFSAASTEIVSETPQDFVLDLPSVSAPDHVFGGSNFNGEEVAWTDTAAHPTGSISGQFGNGVASIDAYNFTRGTGASAPHVAALGVNSYSVGNYKLTSAWSACVSFRADTTAAWAACGLVGRMALGTGWGIGLDATGHGYVLLRGAGATTATATLGTTQHEGGYHKLTIVNDPIGKTITIYDELGNSASASTASLGAIDGATDTAQHIRIGRDADDHDVFPGQIGRVYAWDTVALTAGQVATLSNYAKDPTGKITTYTRTASAYAFGPNDAAGNRTAYLATAAQVAMPYATTLTVDGGTGYGLAVGPGASNLLPDALFTGANWALDASATLTTGVQSATGRMQACTVAGDASNGLKAINIPLAATPGSVVVVFMAKGSGTLNLELRDASDVVKGTGSVALSALWQRFAVTISGWTGSTPTGRVRFVCASSFSLAEVLCVTQGTDVPALLPLPGATHGAYNATCSATISPDVAFNARGEIVAVGCGMIDAPTPAVGTIVQVSNGTNAKNEREVQIVAGSAGFRLAHTDGAASPATVNSTSAYSTYSSRVFTARGRWSRAGLLDNVAPTSFAEVAWTDDTHTTPTLGGAGRTAIWTNDTTQSTIVKLGTGTAAPSDLVLRSVTVQWPESKLA